MPAAVLLVTFLRDNAVPNTESEPNKSARSTGINSNVVRRVGEQRKDTAEIDFRVGTTVTEEKKNMRIRGGTCGWPLWEKAGEGGQAYRLEAFYSNDQARSQTLSRRNSPIQYTQGAEVTDASAVENGN